MRNAFLYITNNEDKYFQLAIHSPNSLPNFNVDKFIKIEHGTSYLKGYSEIQTKLLGSGFDTNCFDYDLDHKFANYNIRSDCITSCLRLLYINLSEKAIQNRILRKQFYQYRRDIKLRLGL